MHWAWKGGGTASSNTDGTITSSVSANTDAGFSVVTWTGNASTGATIGHGLTGADLILMKSIVGTGAANGGWRVGSSAAYMDWTQGYFLVLNEGGGRDASTAMWDTAPTSTVFEVNANASVNPSGTDMIAYVFKNSEIVSTGQYTGNGSAEGPFIHTNPATKWLMIKRMDATNDWRIFDRARNPYNVVDRRLGANTNGAEGNESWNKFDFLSNGFKIRVDDGGYNASGAPYLYLSIGQPTKHTNAE